MQRVKFANECWPYVYFSTYMLRMSLRTFHNSALIIIIKTCSPVCYAHFPSSIQPNRETCTARKSGSRFSTHFHNTTQHKTDIGASAQRFSMIFSFYLRIHETSYFAPMLHVFGSGNTLFLSLFISLPIKRSITTAATVNRTRCSLLRGRQ